MTLKELKAIAQDHMYWHNKPRILITADGEMFDPANVSHARLHISNAKLDDKTVYEFEKEEPEPVKPEPKPAKVKEAEKPRKQIK